MKRTVQTAITLSYRVINNVGTENSPRWVEDGITSDVILLDHRASETLYENLVADAKVVKLALANMVTKLETNVYTKYIYDGYTINWSFSFLDQKSFLENINIAQLSNEDLVTLERG